jgi:hypothetical protein
MIKVDVAALNEKRGNLLKNSYQEIFTAKKTRGVLQVVVAVKVKVKG